MGNCNQRTLYFERNIKNQPTATKYIDALWVSPFKTHRRMAKALVELHKELLNNLESETQIETDPEQI